MFCLSCGNKKLYVINSRATRGGKMFWRRRKCRKCGRVTTTYESQRPFRIRVIKRSGLSERFNDKKLFASIYDAFASGKRADRGDSAKSAYKIITLVENELAKSDSLKINTKELIKMTGGFISKIDRLTAERYRAYSDFRSG